MSTTARPRTRQQSASCTADLTGLGAGVAREDGAVDPALTLLQQHQVELMTPQMLRDAQRRLDLALGAAREGRDADPARLLEQLLTDLGITVSLP